VNAYQRRPEVELYDVRKDPFELKNLAGGPAYKQIETKLRQQLESWMKQQGDLGIETEMAAKTRQERR